MENTNGDICYQDSQGVHSSVQEFPRSLLVPDSQILPNDMVAASAHGGQGQRGSHQGQVRAPPPLQAVTDASENRKLKPKDFAKILDWLESPGNFAMLNGLTSRLPVGERHPSEKTLFRIMLVVLHSRQFPKFVQTGENLGKRFNRYIKKYREAKAMKMDSGAGLTLQELRLGITLEDKLNRICPHFDRMDALYGVRANVDPPALGATGMVGVPEFYHDLADGSDCLDNSDILPDDEEDFTEVDGQDSEDLVGDAPQLGGDSYAASEMEDVVSERGAGGSHPTTTFTIPTDAADRIPQSAIERNLSSAPGQQNPPDQSTANTTTAGTMEDSAPTPIPTTNPANSCPRAGKRPAPGQSQATFKPNFAEVYADKLVGKNDYRQKMIATKDKWRTEDLVDRREARAVLATQAKKRDQITKKHDEKRARLDRQHQIDLIQAEQTTKLLTKLF